jgi:hypothetical protein
MTLSNPHMDILSISWKLFLPGPAEWELLWPKCG